MKTTHYEYERNPKLWAGYIKSAIDKGYYHLAFGYFKTWALMLIM